jgi:hypothetical protein
MAYLRRIQYHAIVYDPDASGGPGSPKLELDSDMLNVVWQQGLNFPGQAAFSMTRYNRKLGSISWMRDHIKIFRESPAGAKTVFAGKLIKPGYSSRDVTITCWDYASFLQRSRTGFRIMYPEKKIGTEIVGPEWALAKAVTDSPFAFVATGTIEDPLALDGVTPVKTNSEFGVVDFDRLFLFYAMAELSMANTSNTVSFEITRESPHTFNFWKNRSVQRTNYAFHDAVLIDYDYSGNQDQIQNDIATIIVDPTTGQQAEYSLVDTGSSALYRRLQSAVTIKTLFGITSGTTATDQQKAALARMLTVSSTPPNLVVAFPRQGEFDPFVNCDLGDSFRTTLRKADRSGDELDSYMKWSGVAAAWTPESGELMQVFLR